MERLWSRQLHQQPNARSIVSRELIIVPERNTKLVRVAPGTGEAIWEADVENTWGWLARNNRCAYWLNQHTVLQCHDLADGRLLWRRDLQGPAGGTFGFLAATERAVLVGGWRGYTDLVCLGAESGDDLWSLPARSRSIATPVVASSGVAIARLDEPTIAVVDVTDGGELATCALPDHARSPDASPLIGRHGEMLLITSKRGECWGLPGNLAGGWRLLFGHADGIDTIVPVFANDSAVFVDGNNHLCSYSLADGALQWTMPWRHNRADLLPAARSDSGILLVGSSFGRLAVVQPDGAVVEEATVAKRIDGPVAWLASDTAAYMTTSELVAACVTSAN